MILEAIVYSKQLKWETKLSVDSQKELERLKADGHPLKLDGKSFIGDYEPENVRNTQLYRTLLHEFGHYVHYLRMVEHPTIQNEPLEDWELRNEKYFKVPLTEKERFAHRYADNLRQKLIENNIIPFNPL